MKKSKQTKKSLQTSLVSLLLCLAMLVGTTFAWFTDSISNKGNIIQSGNLDIGAFAYDVDADGDKTITIDNKDITFETTGEDLETSQTPILHEEKWEPGISNAKLLEVTNKGTLATKIKLDFAVNDGGLQEALWFDFVMVDDNNQVVGSFNKRPMSQLQTMASQVEIKLLTKQSTKFVFIYGMNEEAGNEYQNKTFNVDVTILATQAVEESDGFGNNQYDKDSKYLFSVSSLDEFKDAIEKGGTVELKNDITLENEYLEVKQDLHIVGDGNTLKAPVEGSKKDRVINVTDTTEPINITLQNVNIEGPTTGAYNRGISVYNASEVNLVLDNCSVSTNYYALNIASQCEKVNVTIRNSTLEGYAGIQTHSPNTNITLDNCVIIGQNAFEKSDWNNFAAIVINETAPNTHLTLNNCTIKANQPTGNTEYYLSLRSTGNKIVINNCKYFYNDVEQSLEDAMSNVQVYSSDNSIIVDGKEMAK